jgi:hypothetical protein
MAPADVVGKSVETAYRPGDLLKKWRGLTDAWSDLCAVWAAAAEVASIRRSVT